MELAATSKLPADFFVAGGTVPVWSPSYVERTADRELFDALRAGEFCCVLNSRQMGKSSLAVRTIVRLKEAGVTTAFVDLTRMGGITMTPDQWYAGLLVETGRSLELRKEAGEALRGGKEIGGVQRFLSFLSDVVLTNLEGPIVLMIDEIDAVRSLPYSTDDLFAGLRQLHNGRATHPDLQRLTVCLLGAALPADLIRDPRTTPFNIGRRVELRDFTSEEARPFAGALGERRLARLLYWTGGHPFLTQSLGAELGGSDDVDALVRSRYFGARARETETNLADVARRLLGEGDPSVDTYARVDTLSLYNSILQGRDVVDDEADPAAARIKMSGVAKVENGFLRVRNRIYATTFDRKWVRETMPGQETRRQRKAFLRGFLRAGLMGIAVVATVSTLAVLAVRNANRATRAETQTRRQRDAARYDAYAATMRTMDEARSNHDLVRINANLETLRNAPWRGWEWRFWNRVANHAERVIDAGRYGSDSFDLSPDGRYGVFANYFGYEVIEMATGRPTFERPAFVNTWLWLRDSKRLLTVETGGHVRIFDVATGRVLCKRDGATTHPNFSGQRTFTLPGDRIGFWPTANARVERVDLATLKTIPFRFDRPIEVEHCQVISQDGRFGVWTQMDVSHTSLGIVIANLRTGRTLPTCWIGQYINQISLSPDGRTIACTGNHERVVLIDAGTGRQIGDLRTPCKGAVLSFSPNGRLLLTSGDAKQSVLYEIQGGRLLERERFDDAATGGILLDGRHVFALSDRLRIYRIGGTPLVPQIEAPLPRSQTVPLFVSDKISLIGTDDGYELFSFDPSEPTRHYRNYPSWATFSEKAVIQLVDGRYQVIDGRTGRLRRKLDGVMSGSSVTSEDGTQMTFEDGKGLLNIYRLDRADPPRKLRFITSVSATRFSPDGAQLAVAVDDGTLSLYRLSDLRKIWTDAGPHGLYTMLAFSPDGKKLAAGSQRGIFYTWEIATGRPLLQLAGHYMMSEDVAWSPDGSRIATSSDDGTMRLWDAETGKDFGIIGRHDHPVACIRFIDGGQTLVSVDGTGLFKFWKTSDAGQ